MGRGRARYVPDTCVFFVLCASYGCNEPSSLLSFFCIRYVKLFSRKSFYHLHAWTSIVLRHALRCMQLPLICSGNSSLHAVRLLRGACLRFSRALTQGPQHSNGCAFLKPHEHPKSVVQVQGMRRPHSTDGNWVVGRLRPPRQPAICKWTDAAGDRSLAAISEPPYAAPSCAFEPDEGVCVGGVRVRFEEACQGGSLPEARERGGKRAERSL